MTSTSLKRLAGYSLCLLLWLPAALSAAESTQPATAAGEVTSGNLEARPGYIGSILGVQIEKVLDSEYPESKVIELSVPMAPEWVGGVQVLTPEGALIPQPRDVGMSRNPENNRLQMKIHLPKNKELGFRLKLISETDKFGD